MRRLLYSLAALVILMAAAGAGAIVFVGQHDFAEIAANRASARLGRKVTIGSLRFAPGRWIGIELKDARIDNLPGGSQPAMVQLATLSTEIDALSLLSGPLSVRRLTVDGLHVLLERTADRQANWKFGAAKEDTPPKPADRSRFPTLNAAHVTGDIVFRTSGGAELRTVLAPLVWQADAPDQPVKVTVNGSYNAVPATVEADLGSTVALRDAATPYPTDIRIRSGDTTLHFKGTMTDPFDVDGAVGQLELVAPTPDTLAAVAGVSTDLSASLRLAGPTVHDGPLWKLSDATGALGAGAITAATLALTEGPRGKPDQVSVALAFDQLDLNALSRPKKKTNSADDADVSLAIDSAPDTLVDAKLSARSVAYGAIRATAVNVAASLTPGKIAVPELSLTYLGGRIAANGRVETDGNKDDTGRVSADIDASGMDVQAVRALVGLGAVPLYGRLDGHVSVTATGATVNQAARAGRVSAVVTMAGGSVSRQMVQLASTDPLALFSKPGGVTPVTCFLAAIDMRAGVGTVLPLRLKTDAGTISGTADFDLYRQRFDLVAGSESKTTSLFALDVPVRVFGPFSDPTVRPAKWSAAGRAKLALGNDIGRLAPSLQPFARKSPCFYGGRPG